MLLKIDFKQTGIRSSILKQRYGKNILFHSGGLLFVSSVTAQTTKIKATDAGFSEIRKMAYADSARLVTIFKDFHKNPELGFMEVRTAALLEMFNK